MIISEQCWNTPPEAKQGVSDGGPRPTVDMLEKQRRETIAERKMLIHSWREMVRDVHGGLQRYKLKSIATTPTELLEVHPAFLAFRQYMSEPTKNAIYLGEAVVPPPGSVMHGTLHRVLKDIEHMEKQWGLA